MFRCALQPFMGAPYDARLYTNNPYWRRPRPSLAWCKPNAWYRRTFARLAALGTLSRTAPGCPGENFLVMIPCVTLPEDKLKSSSCADLIRASTSLDRPKAWMSTDQSPWAEGPRVEPGQ